jgi:hypothetical protein
MNATVTGVLGRVFAGLDAAAVRWVVLRGSALLSGPVHDVDVLVAESDIEALEDVVFELGGIALPRALHPWHRFYRIQDPDTGDRLVLDVVTELIYHREQRLRSGLEVPCLARRRLTQGVWVLDPTDLFWTVLLHCLFDKPRITGRRRDELEGALPELTRPSPGEGFFEQVCPPGWSADRAREAVAGHEWDALIRLGSQLRGEDGTPGRHQAESGRTPSLVAPRRVARSAAAVLYPTVWRRAGLGVTPRALAVVEAAGVDAVVVDLRRRPGHCEVLLVLGEHRERVADQLRDHGFRHVLGAWVLGTSVGVERVRVLATGELDLPEDAWPEIWRSATPMAGRLHCRRASHATTYLEPLRAAGRN